MFGTRWGMCHLFLDETRLLNQKLFKTLVSIRDGKMACDLCTARGAEFSGNYTELRRHKLSSVTIWY